MPLLAIDEKQSKELAIAMHEVMKLHDIKLDPRIVAYLNLAGVAGAIYIPKVIAAYAMRKAAEAKQTKPASGAVDLRQKVVDSQTSSAMQWGG